MLSGKVSLFLQSTVKGGSHCVTVPLLKQKRLQRLSGSAARLSVGV